MHPPHEPSTRRSRSLAAAVVLAAYASACTDEPAPREVALLTRTAIRPAAVGCWELRDAFGAPASDRIAWAPPIVQLDSALYPARPAPSHVRRARRFDRAWRPLPLGFERGIDGAMTWQADSRTDSIRVTFNNALFGSVFVLAVPEDRHVDTMRGRAYEFSDSDAERPPHYASVAAVRVACHVPPS